MSRTRVVVLQGAATLAVAMGIGRFAYTPILPLMEHQAGLSSQGASDLATANYAGYLIGALAPTVAPALTRSRLTARLSLLTLIATLALMPASTVPAAWLALRLVAGIASALLFVIAASALFTGAAGRAGWGFSGVGLGIALSGALVLAIGPDSTWRAAWWGAAALAAVLGAAAWTLRPPAAGRPPDRNRAGGDDPGGGRPRTGRWFAALLASYTLEGVGYIIAGTFLVAAVGRAGPAWLGSGAWVITGLAAAPSAAMWARLARRWSRSTLVLTALVVQAAGIALPALAGGDAAALLAAVLFGNTFMAVTSLSLAIGTHLRFPRAVALLTAGYGAGQVLGPLVARPLLHAGPDGYRDALLVAAAVVLAAAAAAAVLRAGFPRRVGTEAEPSAAGPAVAGRR
jgi:MFS family permease